MAVRGTIKKGKVVLNNSTALAGRHRRRSATREKTQARGQGPQAQGGAPEPRGVAGVHSRPEKSATHKSALVSCVSRRQRPLAVSQRWRQSLFQLIRRRGANASG